MDDDLRKKLNEHYQLGQGSIQDLARVYRLDVNEVLDALGLHDMLTVESVGDLVDASELDPDTHINPYKRHRAKYTTN